MADAAFIGAIVALVVFYVIIVVVGILSSIYFKRKYNVDSSDMDFQIVAGRKLGSVVGWLTMSATLVGGGFLNGTAEMVALDGLVWTLPPFGICIGLSIGGLVFAPPMRKQNYRTMLDPMEERYGSVVTAVIYIASLFGDILWSASILAALGTSLHVIIGLNIVMAVIVSAAVAVFYTLIGQMISVAYTDVVELIFLLGGLSVVTPFVMTHPDVKPKLYDSVYNNNGTGIDWLGSIQPNMAAFWADLAVAMTLGSIPWQSYFQRVLSVRSVGDARRLSFLAGLSSLVCAVPPICLGVVGATVDWTATGLNDTQYNDKSLTLPLVVREFTPPVVSVVGLGAIAAAVMSSTDSAILGSSSMFTHNVYQRVRPKASPLELSIILKVCIVLVGVISTVVALTSPNSLTIAGLFILAADVVFVATLPQLICSLFIPVSNGYGALIGYILSLALRLGAGEGLIGLATTIKFPYYSEDMHLQLFPFRTFTMLLSIIITVTVSFMTKKLIMKLGPKYDFLRCTHPIWRTSRESQLSVASYNVSSGLSSEKQNDDAAKQSIPFQDFD